MSTAPSQPLLLASIVIPGECVGKKTSPRVIYPALAGLKIPRQNGKGCETSLKRVFMALAGLAQKNPSLAAAQLRRAAELCNPKVLPSSEYAAWHKKALPLVEAVPGKRPLLPEGHLGKIEAVIYLGKGQTGDLVNFLQGIWDLLQDAGLIGNDYWVNSADGSERRWDDPYAPRTEINLWDLGVRLGAAVPMVRVEGLTAAKEQFGPLEFSVTDPAGRCIPLVTVPRGSSRGKVSSEAARIWRQRFKEPLPPGSTILVGEKRLEEPQLPLEEESA